MIVNALEKLGRDLRYAFRVLRRAPVYTFVTTLSLGLGIGVNTAVFSVVYAVLLRPLPYPQPDRLVRLADAVQRDAISIPELEYCRKNGASFSSLAGYRGLAERRLSSGTAQEWIKTLTVTTQFLRTIGTGPALGREFTEEEASTGGPRAVVISDGFWRRVFAGDPAARGRTVRLDDSNYTVVGILPPGFWFPQQPDALVPLRASSGLADLGANTRVIARLKDGVHFGQAVAELAGLSEGFRRANAGQVGQNYRGMTAISLHESWVGSVRLKLILLFGATGLLLLIGCSNLASLMLSRLTSRVKELGVRLALGSSKQQLLRQFLMENLAIAVLGAAAGLLSAYCLLEGLLALVPFALPAAAPIRLNLTVLAFTLVVGVGTALVFTLLSSVVTARLDVNEALKAAGRTTGSGGVRLRTRNFLLAGEVAVAATLLAAAGLLVQSLYRLHSIELGFKPERLITFQTPLAASRHRDPATLARTITSMVDSFAAVPGVRDVGGVNVLPLTERSNLPAQRDGHPEQSIGGMEIRVATPGYFKAMGIAIRRGRVFAGTERTGSPYVAVINETLARRWWPAGDALGDRVVIGKLNGKDFPEIKDTPREVVGVVADTKIALTGPPLPIIYVSVLQASDMFAQTTFSMAWVVSANNNADVPGNLRRAIEQGDSGQRLRPFRTMDEIVASTTATAKFDAWLFAVFAGVALALTAAGIYGLVSFSVVQRRQEIGIRMVLGATRGTILRLLMKQGLVPTAIGLVLGLIGSRLLTGWLGTLLYGIKSNDPTSFAAGAVLLLLAAVLASYFPGRHATSIDIIKAVRHD